MPVVNGTGCSEETPRKLEDLETALRVWFAIAKEVAGKRNQRLTIIDATAGPGVYRQCLHCGKCDIDAPLRGSPKIIIDILRHGSIPADVVLVDSNLDNIKSLHETLDVTGCDISLDIKEGRYQEVLADIRTTKYGLLLIDENGLPDFEFITDFYTRNYTTIDILLNVPCTSTKRRPGLTRLDEYIESVPKKHWAIREVRTKWHWTQVFGTNWKTLIRKIEGYNHHFFGKDTEKGRAELEKASRTKEERQKKTTQLTLNI